MKQKILVGNVIGTMFILITTLSILPYYANLLNFSIYSETLFEISEHTNNVTWSFADIVNTSGETIHFGIYDSNLDYSVGGYTMKWEYYIVDAPMTGITSYIFDPKNWDNWDMYPNVVYGLAIGFNGLSPTAQLGIVGPFTYMLEFLMMANRGRTPLA